MSLISDQADAAAAAAAAAKGENQSDEEKKAAQDAADKAAADKAAAAGGNPGWNEGVDESMRERMGKFKDVNSLAKSYIELETKLGEGFKAPETDEDKAKLWAKLGRPADADSYELEGEDELGFRAHAFELGLSQAQVTRHAVWFKSIMAKHTEGLEEKSKASEVKLREVWGDQYKDNMALANRALSNIYSENLIDRLEMGGFLDDQEFVSHLYRQGKRTADDTLGAGGNLAEVERTEAGQPFLDFPSMKEYDD
jgi:hypothetical protein